jgi:RNA polymerase sigma-70 factor (ECF subfamily)
MRPLPENRSETVVAFPRSRLTDAELVHAVCAGDHDALSAIWTRYVSDVRAMIHSSLGPDPAIDDLVQEVFVGFYRNASRLENPRALRSYLLGIAARLSAFELRTRTRRFRWLRFTKSGALPDVPAESPVEPRDSLRTLRGVLSRVPELPRMAFLLRYVEDLSPEEVAVALGVSTAKARRAITHGRERVLTLGQREPALLPYLEPWLEGR